MNRKQRPKKRKQYYATPCDACQGRRTIQGVEVLAGGLTRPATVKCVVCRGRGTMTRRPGGPLYR